MAVLTTEEKLEVWTEFMQNSETLSNSMSNKNDLRDALIAVYGWLNNNQADLVSSMPSGARPVNDGLTSKQITLALSLMVKKMLTAEV